MSSEDWLRLSIFYGNVLEAQADLRAFGVIPKPYRRSFVRLRTQANAVVRQFGETSEPLGAYTDQVATEQLPPNVIAGR